MNEISVPRHAPPVGAHRLSESERRALAARTTRRRPAYVTRVFTVVAVLSALLFVQSLIASPAVGWDTIAQYLFNARVLNGVLVTIQITVLSLLVGFSSGLIIALMRLSQSAALRGIALVWVWFFRAVPVLVVLILVNNIAILYPELGIGVPFGPMIWSTPTAQLMSPFVAAVLAFGANEGAYASEIFRASINSVPKGQWEAAVALGMPPVRTNLRIVLPQAMRFAIPPLSNNAINMIKGTTLVSFIGVSDILYTVQSIYAQSYEVIAMLFVACIWYLVLVSAMTAIQALLERKFDQQGRSPRKALPNMKVAGNV